MDIKLKNNRKARTGLALTGILIITAITMCFFPAISRQANAKLDKVNTDMREQAQEKINTDLLRELYRGCYVLYFEAIQRDGVQDASDIYLKTSYSGRDEETEAMLESLKDQINSVVYDWGIRFEDYRSELDYCIEWEGESYEKNTSQPLEKLFSGAGRETTNQLIEHYSAYFFIHFDENGMITMEPVFSGNADEDVLIKEMGRMVRETDVWYGVAESYDEDSLDYKLKQPTNVTIAFAIPRTSNYQLVNADYENGADYWTVLRTYADEGGELLFIAVFVLLTMLVFVMTSGRIWKCEIDLHRPGKWYLMEAAFVGICSVLSLHDSFIGLIYKWFVTMNGLELGENLTSGDVLEMCTVWLAAGFSLFCIYGVWYLSVRFIRPVFALGVREYIREYSFFYQIFPWIKKQWDKLKHEAAHIDFSEASIKTIVKIVVINFIVLTCCSFLWFFGILALVVYSLVLFFVIENYYSKARVNYQALLRGVNRIAEGDLDTEITEDLGMFEPFKGELAKVRTGFKKAVDEEVKSQRMKTELITNVSHDLKTPLTAITTYVELLKKEDITEEERRSYIEILERKSLRLKVLVEDLFEVSKATSNNINIELMDVDVIHLMKQVSVEHAEKFTEMGLDLRWNVPQEKMILALDNQKTYRIFENLFGNIQKYAMPHSRVYIDVKQENGQVEITVKNMSATELNIHPDELTERFVRGDVSRNTEGSGLGLAIAKSFTEAQGGNFRVEVDGDLFKAVIRWKNIQVGTVQK